MRWLLLPGLLLSLHASADDPINNPLLCEPTAGRTTVDVPVDKPVPVFVCLFPTDPPIAFRRDDLMKLTHGTTRWNQPYDDALVPSATTFTNLDSTRTITVTPLTDGTEKSPAVGTDIPPGESETFPIRKSEIRSYTYYYRLQKRTFKTPHPGGFFFEVKVAAGAPPGTGTGMGTGTGTKTGTGTGAGTGTGTSGGTKAGTGMGTGMGTGSGTGMAPTAEDTVEVPDTEPIVEEAETADSQVPSLEVDSSTAPN